MLWVTREHELSNRNLLRLVNHRYRPNNCVSFANVDCRAQQHILHADSYSKVHL